MMSWPRGSVKTGRRLARNGANREQTMAVGAGLAVDLDLHSEPFLERRAEERVAPLRSIPAGPSGAHESHDELSEAPGLHLDSHAHNLRPVRHPPTDHLNPPPKANLLPSATYVGDTPLAISRMLYSKRRRKSSEAQYLPHSFGNLVRVEVVHAPLARRDQRFAKLGLLSDHRRRLGGLREIALPEQHARIADGLADPRRVVRDHRTAKPHRR